MRIIGAIQAFNEEATIGAAVRSLLESGCDEVFVLDGPWLLPDGSLFGGGLAPRSTDYTLAEAEQAGARIGPINLAYPNDAAKQTALIHGCGATKGDYIVKLDADEQIHGDLYTAGSHTLIMLRNHGDNDLPGIRGTWPRGDDGTEVPLLRMFKYDRRLVCTRPGRWQAGLWIEPYLVGALEKRAHDPVIGRAHRVLREYEHLLRPADLAALPILDGVWIDHYRTGAKAEAKRVYYEAMA